MDIPDIYWPVLIPSLNVFHVQPHHPAYEEDMFSKCFMVSASPPEAPPSPPPTTNVYTCAANTPGNGAERRPRTRTRTEEK